MNVPRVQLVGSRTARSAFAVMNRHWADALAARHDLELAPDADAGTDLVIVNDYSQRFDAPGVPRAPDVPAVAARPWDFGPYPRRWVEVAQRYYAELWVHSHWTRRNAIDGGLDPSRVHVVPLGMDASVMHPGGVRAALPVGDRFVFLFVGAAIHRKGIDLLLDAYRRAFTVDDDVALVVKDHTGDVFYRELSYRDRILDAAAAPGPPIVYLDDYLDAATLAALYRRADVFVSPYRAEGFAIPVLEAMACGTPAMVPAHGPSLDYCDAASAFLVPTRVVTLPVRRTFQTNTLAFEEFVDTVRFTETTVDRLIGSLRDAYAARGPRLEALGRAAAARAAGWTWAASAATIAARVHALQPVIRR